MNVKLVITLFLLIFPTRLQAQEIEASDNLHPNQVIPKTFLPLMIDPHFTMRSGVEDIITLHHGWSIMEDKLIGTKWFSESNILGKTGGILARFTKLALLDIPVDYFSIVFAHEYFGHGARYREFDMSNIHYAYDFPPPYGAGGGEASNTTNVQLSTHQILSLWQGGLEVHPIINRNLGMRWISNEEMTYREASQYFWSFQIAYTYVQDSDEYLGDGLKDNDPRAYTRILNANSGYNNADKLKMTVEDLKSKFMINMANPFVLYSIYSILKTFLWDGNISNNVPSIKFGKVNYLPSLRVGLTPFGIEYHLENYLKFNNTTAMVDIKYGDQSFHNNWGGLGLHINNFYETPNYSLDVNANIWQQPKLQFSLNQFGDNEGGFGAAFSARGYYRLSANKLPIFAVLELGYKTVGFLEGYDLDSSPIFMLGLAIKY